MELLEALRSAQGQVLDDACAALERAHLPHYQGGGSDASRRHLSDLLLLVLDSIDERTLVPISQYAETVARERFAAGFDIAEVQTALNVLEEAIWHVVIPRLSRDDLVAATGLIGTVFGAGKDALARTWVSLATSEHVASLDLSALFRGAGS